MAEKLTPQQAQAVHDRGGRLLVSAAAGSGKTKVLVDRLMTYLTDPAAPADLDDFLIITYTKAAAAELRGKIAAKLSERISAEPENRHLQSQMQRLYLTKISTVHSFCSDLLREHAYRLDLSADFRVADENECRELRETVLAQLLDDAYENLINDADFRAFVDTQGLGRNDALVPLIIEKVYDSARCHLDPDAWLNGCIGAADLTDISDAAQTPWGRFLMDDLFQYLDWQIGAMESCVKALVQAEGMEKPAALLGDTMYQLRRLRESQSWDDVVRNKDIDFGRLTFPRKCTDPELAERVKAIRNACKKGVEKRCRGFADDSAQVLKDLSGASGAVRGLIALVREFDRRYDRAKRSRRVLDFGDLEHKTLDLLLGKRRVGPTAVAVETGRRFREILVDEYQDSNQVQDAIFCALTEQKQNLFMVGDVKQSIYQFRLADPGIFLEKYAKFVHAGDAEPGQGRKVLLSSNFRSGGAVLSATNDVFRACMSTAVGGLEYGSEEALREGIPHEPLGEPEVELHMVSVREETYPEEAAYVAQRIRTLLDGTHMVRSRAGLRPIAADDVVILLRSPGSVGAYYQAALEKLGIRCTTGAGTDLLQAPEIQVLRSLLQTISNPRQDIPLLAVLTSPLFAFTADDLASIRAAQKRGSIYDALAASGTEKAAAFIDMLEELRREARMGNLAQLLESIFAMTRLDAIYGAMADGAVRTANLQAFFQLASDFEHSARRDLSQFLEHLDALSEKGLATSADQTSGAVTIMSIHKSKGLEFPVVFLCGLSREFNRENIRAQVLCDKALGLGLSCVDTKNRVRYPTISKRAIAVKATADSLSEELRVLYVAMTRARDRLIMTYASRDPGGEVSDIASRMDLGCRELLTADVVCPGEWVLYAALRRTEAGALHNIGGRPDQTVVSDHPWFITVGDAPAADGAAATLTKETTIRSGETVEKLRQALSYRYPHEAATMAPSKQTATALKGRLKDQEAAEHAREPQQPHRSWRKPTFREAASQGRTYGTTVHTVLQHIRFEHCGGEAGIREEVERLVSQGILTPEQGRSVNCGKLAAFFASELGGKLRTGKKVLREFKFSILDGGSNYGDGLEEEQVLLQGVVDCALVESDGITVIDFKTDYVTEETLAEVTARYTPQVRAYAHAMSRIFETNVKAAYLYYFHLDQFVNV